jgi:hypothetical protein
VAVGAAETTPVIAVTNLVRTLKLLKDAGCGSWARMLPLNGARGRS